jgi:DNA-binding MarR family transcriptional regulator
MRDEKRQIRAEATRECMKSMRSFLVAFKGLLEDELSDAGFTLAQMRLLYAVKEKAGVSAAELGRTCEITPQTTQALLTRAEREKWIKRSKSAKNGRILTTELTPKGEALLERGRALSARLEAMLWDGVKLSEVRQINERLQIILERTNAARRTVAD